MTEKHGITETLRAFTTTVFRCSGLYRDDTAADRFGLHDLAWWLVFGSLGAAWYFMLFQPQRARLEMLNGRQNVLNNQLKAEDLELNRVRREIKALANNDLRAWERAARSRLGWLKPGEVVDVLAWRRQRIEDGFPDPFHIPRVQQPSPDLQRYRAVHANSRSRFQNRVIRRQTEPRSERTFTPFTPRETAYAPTP